MKTPFIGHKKIWQALQNLQKEGRLPHALLLIGPQGIGKSLVAHHLARAILCESQEPPCNQCGQCLACQEGRHPDLHRLGSEGEVLKIDEIREIKKTLAYPPLMASRRVVLISEAHRLNMAAANALLKSLEEPPAGTFFILVTHALGWVPRTIVSRCQKFLFSRLSDAELAKILQKQDIELPQEQLTWCQGSVGLALRLASCLNFLPNLSELANSENPPSFSECYALMQHMLESSEIETILDGLLAASHQRLVKEDSELNRFDLLQFTDRIHQLRQGLRQNINPKIHLLRLLLHFQEPRAHRL